MKRTYRSQILPNNASGIFPVPLAPLFIWSFFISLCLVCCLAPRVASAQSFSKADEFPTYPPDTFLEGRRIFQEIENTYDNVEFDTTISQFDSLQLKLFDIEIARTQLDVTTTNFWHRLFPQIHVSASFGVKDIMFIDPNNYVPYVLPKDAYRLTLSISLSNIFDFTKNSKAKLELEKLETQLQTIKIRQTKLHALLSNQLSTLNELTTMLLEEMKMKEDIVKFNEMRFKQGKIEYDAMINSKLELLAIKKNLLYLNQQKLTIKSKLSIGGTL